MIWVLAFIFICMATAAWDVSRINALYARIAKPGPRKPTVELPQAPRFAISSPSANRRSPASFVEPSNEERRRHDGKPA